jgi:O-antigen ligase
LKFGIRFLPAALVLLAVGGLVDENFSHYPVGILFLFGLFRIWQGPQEVLGTNDARFLIGVFACIWLPMLAALPDAVNPARAIKTTVFYLHFLPAGLYVTYILRDLVVRRILLSGIAAIVAFWCFDAIVQLLTGRDLFGYPYDGSVLKGVFHPKQRLGLVLAVFAPLYFHVVQSMAQRSRWAWLLLIPFIVVVIYSLKRTAWVMLVAACFAYVTCFLRVERLNMRIAALGACIAVIMLSLIGVSTPQLIKQADDTLDVFSFDFETVDVATSHRLSLWKTGLSIARANWLNGVGPRGYRDVYRDFASADDFWIMRGTDGQTHPHLMFLEVVIETGIVGGIGYIACLCLLIRRLWHQRRSHPAGAAYLLVAVIAWLPLNAHLAFYGSYWANISWLMIALGCSSAGSSNDRRSCLPHKTHR